MEVILPQEIMADDEYMAEIEYMADSIGYLGDPIDFYREFLNSWGDDKSDYDTMEADPTIDVFQPQDGYL